MNSIHNDAKISMQIDPGLLITWGAIAKRYQRNDIIFYEGDPCRFYHQIVSGRVQMCNYNEEGRIFIQGMFEKGESFGDPPLFIDEPYPASAQAVTDCVIYKLCKDSLFKLLEENPELQMKFIVNFAKRIYAKTNTNKTIANPHPEERIHRFLVQFKNDFSSTDEKVLVPYTRQQIANFLGLRVETVIRTLKKMVKDQKVDIRNHKLYC